MNNYIDHTNLKADAIKADIIKLCEEAITYDFASVCVNGYWVSLCKERLHDTNVKVCTVIGFPLGASTTLAKVYEAQNAIENGADEIDMVLNIGELKAHQFEEVRKDIQTVRDATKDKCLKVIIECCLLTKEEIKKTCELCVACRADYVKTSTGCSHHGATIEDVKLMKESIQGKCKIKAAGGIRTKKDAEAMILAGADRIGTSAGTAFLK